MAIKQIDIKRELTEEEFKEIVIVCEQKFEQESQIEKIALGCEEKTKEITPAKEAFVLLPKHETKEFEVITLDKSIPMRLDEESVITECYKTKQSLIINDVVRSFLYNEKFDNFMNYELKDLLLIPVVDDTEEKNVLAIMWAAITKGNWNQYTQKDLNYMTRFSIFIKRFLQEKNLIETKEKKDDASFLDCMDAYDKLSAKNRREQEYFSSIIHDVRTPMNAVIGFLELLNLKEDDKEKKEYLEIALKSAETMVTLINDALDISKMASGKMNIENVEFSVFKELSDVAKLFHNTAKKKNISFHTFYDPNIPKTIVSDYHRIKQIMNNLLSNAIKFTPEDGEIFLEILYDKKYDGITISVKDNGPGISEEMQKDIFSPYTQEKKSTAREHGGTGLGLSISQQLSILLGGILKLESTIGQGSRFYFSIPCNTLKGTPNAFKKKPLQKTTLLLYINPELKNNALHSFKKYLDKWGVNYHKIHNSQEFINFKENFNTFVVLREDAILTKKHVNKLLDLGKSSIIVGDTFLEECRFERNVQKINTPLLPDEIYKALLLSLDKKFSNTMGTKKLTNLQKFDGKTILVVDDNSINLKFMQEVLKTMDINVLLSSQGLDAIEKYKSNNIDLIFMDENMPGLQGSEAIKLIREYEKKHTKKTSVIIGLTGNADQETSQELQGAGANTVLTKPIQLQEIQKAIAKYL
jgi:signal transduction histidine kinase/ActR/RegA family two-component response regulator